MDKAGCSTTLVGRSLSEVGFLLPGGAIFESLRTHDTYLKLVSVVPLIAYESLARKTMTFAKQSLVPSGDWV